MTNATGFPWPPLGDGGPVPCWDGARFRVGGEFRHVLQYSRDESAWDAALTGFHEETASSDHPMDLASRRTAVAALSSRLPPHPGVILEVGTSSGFLLPLLRAAFPGTLVIGSDAFPEALQAFSTREPGFPLLQFDLTRCPLPDASVDAVVALNVLEHIRDDRLALGQIARILRPGGLAYVEVPAGAHLYDIYDEMLHHYRRYDRGGFERLAAKAGLALEWASHLGCLVFPLFAATKLRDRRLLEASPEVKARLVARHISGSRASRPLAWALALERRLGRLIRFPWGIRLVSVLRKPV